MVAIHLPLHHQRTRGTSGTSNISDPLHSSPSRCLDSFSQQPPVPDTSCCTTVTMFHDRLLATQTFPIPIADTEFPKVICIPAYVDRNTHFRRHARRTRKDAAPPQPAPAPTLRPAQLPWLPRVLSQQLRRRRSMLELRGERLGEDSEE